MLAAGPPSRSFFIGLLRGATTLAQLCQAHAHAVVHGLAHDLALVAKLAHRLSDLAAVSHARALLLSIPAPDLFLFNVVVKGFAANGRYLSSLSLYAHLRKRTALRPDEFTYSFAVSAASGLRDSKHGVSLHAHAVVDGFARNLFVGSALVDFYFRFSEVGIARKVFEEMPERDRVVFNMVISGLERNGNFRGSVGVFSEMVRSGDGFDPRSLAAVLPASAELGELHVGAGIHCLALKAGFDGDVYVVTGLVSMYSKCNEIRKARSLFGTIRYLDLVCCNAMIAGFTYNNDTEASLRLFKRVIVSGEKVTSSTIVGLIPVSSPFGHLQLTSSIQGFCLRFGILSRPSVSTALVTVYSRLNELKSARQLFDELPEKCITSWNSMISGYAQNGLTEDAIYLFKEMTPVFTPNPTTVTSVLSACAQLGTLSLGKWIHGLIESKNLEANVFVRTALVDMYAKCGSILKARELFDLMTEKNVVTWNTMISGYGLHGHGHEAIRLFNQMSHSLIAPNGVTFLSVLYACSHSGLVREGKAIFNSMVNDHGFDPLAEHYACMVDILGRAGKLEEALEFITKMPVDPGVVVWGSLLGACMTHKHTRITQIASKKVFELDPGNTGYYVLLSNIYSADRNFPKAASVRQVVRNRNLEKTPGCTLIEIGEVTHVFTAGDRSHPKAKEIYIMLDKIGGKMKEAGFQTDNVTALHDVEEEEKELMVKVHSEKLAIVFGLIVTEPGTEIRIIKNLRVCLDCHNATKFISKITERVIVVRDANRFHRFEGGACSCGDYW